jgi:hypothetical protein
MDAWQVSEIQCRRQLTGKSGAYVYLVDIRTPRHDGLAILKLSTANHWGEPEEHTRLEQARILSPQFAHKHLPASVSEFRSGDLIATLSTVASDGLNYTTALFDIAYQPQIKAGQAITYKLLSVWNSNSKIADRPLSVDSILGEWLGYRLKSTTRLSSVPEEIFGFSSFSDSFRISGNDYPNPLRLATGAFPSKSIILSPILGCCHGDLHGYNILVPVQNTDDPGFCIIDLALFRENWPLFYDHAYLELSLILKERDQAGIEHWLTIINALEGVEDNRDVARVNVDTNDLGLIRTISFFRAGVKSWILKKHKNRRQDLNNQLLLARIAAGLNFANKSTLSGNAKRSDALSGYAFLFAASNARKLLEFNKLSFPKDGPLAILKGDLPEPTSPRWREVWDQCDSFDRRRNAFILIASAELRNIPREFRSELGKIPWTLVLDFDQDTDNDGLLSESRSLLASSRGFHFLLPSQVEQPNLREATCWLMSNGWSKQPDSIPVSKEAWSKRTPARIRQLAEDIRAATSPLPITTILMSQGINPALLRQSVVALGEFLSSQQKILVLKNSPDDQSYAAIKDDVECVELQCTYSDFALGLHRMLGPAEGAVAIQLPCRDPSTSRLSRIPLDSELASRFSETMEVVHDGLAFEAAVTQAEVSEFLKGNTISWKELDLDLDAKRDITAEALSSIRSLLKQSRSVSYRLAHTPGAGGTTVVRRIAWELRNEYPTVVLKVFLDTTADYIESLFHFTNLPVLIIAERSNISPLLREKLFLDLKARSVRFVIFDVVSPAHLISSKISPRLLPAVV